MNIKAIETVYKGYRFRSRLEARWAVFFDALGIKWVYEKEGFDLDGIWYLPDFWLPDYRYWVEIKGESPSESEIKKCSLLAQKAGCCVFLFSEEVWLSEQANNAIYFDHMGAHTDGFCWTECPFCGSVDIMLFGLATFPFQQCLCWKNLSINTDPQTLVKEIWHVLSRFHLDEVAFSDIEFFVLRYVSALEKKQRTQSHYENTDKLKKAYVTSRQARFEHGETPNKPY